MPSKSRVSRPRRAPDTAVRQVTRYLDISSLLNRDDNVPAPQPSLFSSLGTSSPAAAGTVHSSTTLQTESSQGTASQFGNTPRPSTVMATSKYPPIVPAKSSLSGDMIRNNAKRVPNTPPPTPTYPHHRVQLPPRKSVGSLETRAGRSYSPPYLTRPVSSSRASSSRTKYEEKPASRAPKSPRLEGLGYLEPELRGTDLSQRMLMNPYEVHMHLNPDDADIDIPKPSEAPCGSNPPLTSTLPSPPVSVNRWTSPAQPVEEKTDENDMELSFYPHRCITPDTNTEPLHSAHQCLMTRDSDSGAAGSVTQIGAGDTLTSDTAPASDDTMALEAARHVPSTETIPAVPSLDAIQEQESENESETRSVLDIRAPDSTPWDEPDTSRAISRHCRPRLDYYFNGREVVRRWVYDSRFTGKIRVREQARWTVSWNEVME